MSKCLGKRWDVPRHSTAFHFVRQFHIFGVNVELPLSLTQNTGQNCSRVNAHSHVHRWIRSLLHVPTENGMKTWLEIGLWTLKILLYSLDHGKSHVYAKNSMIGSFPGSPTDAIVTISQNFDSELLVFLRIEKKNILSISIVIHDN